VSRNCDLSVIGELVLDAICNTTFKKIVIIEAYDYQQEKSKEDVLGFEVHNPTVH